MTTPRHFVTLLVLLALAACTAHAGEHEAITRPAGAGAARERIVLADSGMSLDQAVSMVEKRFKARVVRTETRNEGDRKVYVLRLLNDAGRVWTVKVDAASGSVS
jgi:uncharacterized membrane protein YkoI